MKIRLMLLGLLSVMLITACSNDSDDTLTPDDEVIGGGGGDDGNGDGSNDGDSGNSDGDGDSGDGTGDGSNGDGDGNNDDSEAIIFTGETITFTRPDGVDFMLPENQDMITENVIITRGNGMGIFNIAQESAFASGRRNSPSPIGTLWAVGTTADDLSGLTFATWSETMQSAGGPRAAADNRVNLVLQITEENIFIDVVFTSFTGGGSGGGFSYERSTEAQ